MEYPLSISIHDRRRYKSVDELGTPRLRISRIGNRRSSSSFFPLVIFIGGDKIRPESENARARSKLLGAELIVAVTSRQRLLQRRAHADRQVGLRDGSQRIITQPVVPVAMLNRAVADRQLGRT